MASRASKWTFTVPVVISKQLERGFLSRQQFLRPHSVPCMVFHDKVICSTSTGCTGSYGDHLARFHSNLRYKYLARCYSSGHSLSQNPSATISQGTGSNQSNTSNDAASMTGDEIYQQAMQAMEALHSLRQQKEEERSAKMYEAWEKAKNAQKSPKDQGIKVIKTLAKETRKETQNQHHQDNQEKASYQRAMDLLQQAAFQHNHPMALIQLGNMALERAGSADLKESTDTNICQRKAEIETAIQLFHKAGLAGSRVGWYNLGHLYWTGYPAIEVDDDNDEDDHDMDHDDDTYSTRVPQQDQILQPDLHEAMDAFGKAIDLGDTDAMYLVGVHRMTAGGRENIHSGLKLVERAGNEGHGGALYYLALLHLNGEPTIGLAPCSEMEFMQRLDRAVEAGNVDALFTRGHSYYHGTEGYPQNYPRALQDFLQAAEEGHADSAVSAGAMLHAGIGVPKDQERAFELYQTAGELGSIEGWKNVVACYLTGEGVPQSLETARYISETMLSGKDNRNNGDTSR